MRAAEVPCVPSAPLLLRPHAAGEQHRPFPLRPGNTRAAQPFTGRTHNTSPLSDKEP